MSAGVHARAERTCHSEMSIKIPHRGCVQGCEWRYAPEAWDEIWERSVGWVLPLEEEGWLSLAHRGLAAGVTHSLEQMKRSGVSLSLCRKTFKLKGNIKFRTWTKKSQVFFVFRDSYVIYIWVMNILCTFHIFMYGYVPNPTLSRLITDLYIYIYIYISII